MPDDVLRLRATVVSDEALANIRKIGREIGLVQQRGGAGAKAATGSWTDLSKVVKSVSSGVEGALGAMGPWGLAAGATVFAATKLIGALGDVSAKMVQLSYASKELGISETALRSFADEAQKAGIAPEQMMQGLQNFKRNTEDFGMRIGQLRGQMVAMGAGPVLNRINAATSQLDKLKVAYDFKETLDKSDPTGMKARRFFEMIGLGADAARLSWEDFSRTMEAKKPLSDEDMRKAKQFHDSLVQLGSTWDDLKMNLGVALFPSIRQDLRGLNDVLEILNQISSWKLPSFFSALNPSTLGDRTGRALGLDPFGLRAKHDQEDRVEEQKRVADAQREVARARDPQAKASAQKELEDAQRAQAERRAYRGDTEPPPVPANAPTRDRARLEADRQNIIAGDQRLKDEAAAAAAAKEAENKKRIDDGMARMREMQLQRQQQAERMDQLRAGHPPAAVPPQPPPAAVAPQAPPAPTPQPAPEQVTPQAPPVAVAPQAPPTAVAPQPPPVPVPVPQVQPAPVVTAPPVAPPAPVQAAPPAPPQPDTSWRRWFRQSSAEGGDENDFRQNIHLAGGFRQQAPARIETTPQRPMGAGAGDETGASRIIQIGVFDALVQFKSYLEAGSSAAGGGGAGGAAGGGGGGRAVGGGGMPGVVRASLGGQPTAGGGGGGWAGGGGGTGGGGGGGISGLGGGAGPSGATVPSGGGGQAAPQPGPGGQGTAPGTLGAAGGKSGFYDEQRKLIYDAAVKAGLPHPEVVAEVGATQAQLESGGGQRTPGGFNVYGIKSGGGVGGVGAPVSTQEAGPGGMRTEKASFATFQSKEEAAAGYVSFLQQHPKHYAGVTGAATVAEGLQAQGTSGYATDPNYLPKLQQTQAQFGGKTIPGAPIGGGGAPTAGSFAGDVTALMAQGGKPKNIQDYLAAHGVNMSQADCAAFMAQQVREHGGTPPQNPNIASSWNAFGEAGYSADPNAINIAVKQGVQTGSTGSHVAAAVPELDEQGQPTGRFTGVGVNQGFGKGSMRVAGKGDYGRDVITSNPIDIGTAPGQYQIRHQMRPPPDQPTVATARIDQAVSPPTASGQVNVTVNSNGTKAEADTKTAGNLFQPPTIRQHRQMQPTENASGGVSI